MGTLRLEGKIPKKQENKKYSSSKKDSTDMTIEELAEHIRNKIQRIYEKKSQE